METSFTKGPWNWDRVDNQGTLQLMGDVEYPDQNPILVARKCNNNGGLGCQPGGDRYCPLEPTVADRHLIEVSPDLLEVAKELVQKSLSMVENLEAEFGGCYKIEELRQAGDIPEEIIKMEQIIAKAEGEEDAS